MAISWDVVEKYTALKVNNGGVTVSLICGHEQRVTDPADALLVFFGSLKTCADCEESQRRIRRKYLIGKEWPK